MMKPTSERLPVTHDVSAPRFEVRRGAAPPAFLRYLFADDLVVFEHTEVPNELRGQGIAAQLVRFAPAEARQRHWRIVPRCGYVAGLIARHAEFADLIAPTAQQ